MFVQHLSVAESVLVQHSSKVRARRSHWSRVNLLKSDHVEECRRRQKSMQCCSEKSRNTQCCPDMATCSHNHAAIQQTCNVFDPKNHSACLCFNHEDLLSIVYCVVIRTLLLKGYNPLLLRSERGTRAGAPWTIITCKLSQPVPSVEILGQIFSQKIPTYIVSKQIKIKKSHVYFSMLFVNWRAEVEHICSKWLTPAPTFCF